MMDAQELRNALDVPFTFHDVSQDRPTAAEALKQLIIYHGCQFDYETGEPCIGGEWQYDPDKGEEPCLHCVANLILCGDRPLTETELAVLRFDKQSTSDKADSSEVNDG